MCSSISSNRNNSVTWIVRSEVYWVSITKNSCLTCSFCRTSVRFCCFTTNLTNRSVFNTRYKTRNLWYLIVYTWLNLKSCTRRNLDTTSTCSGICGDNSICINTNKYVFVTKIRTVGNCFSTTRKILKMTFCCNTRNIMSLSFTNSSLNESFGNPRRLPIVTIPSTKWTRINLE